MPSAPEVMSSAPLDNNYYLASASGPDSSDDYDIAADVLRTVGTVATVSPGPDLRQSTFADDDVLEIMETRQPSLAEDHSYPPSSSSPGDGVAGALRQRSTSVWQRSTSVFRRAFNFASIRIRRSMATPKGPQGMQIKDFLEGFGDDSIVSPLNLLLKTLRRRSFNGATVHLVVMVVPGCWLSMGAESSTLPPL